MIACSYAATARCVMSWLYQSLSRSKIAIDRAKLAAFHRLLRIANKSVWQAQRHARPFVDGPLSSPSR